jgi:hypothetical protein
VDPARGLSAKAAFSGLGAIDWELGQESKSMASIAKSSKGRSTSGLLAAHLNPRVSRYPFCEQESEE